MVLGELVGRRCWVRDVEGSGSDISREPTTKARYFPLSNIPWVLFRCNVSFTFTSIALTQKARQWNPKENRVGKDGGVSAQA